MASAVIQAERESLTGLRVLIPDGKHVSGGVLSLLNSKGLLDYKFNGELHVDVKEQEFPLSFTVQKNRGIPGMEAEGRFHLGFTTTDRLEDYLAWAATARSRPSTSVKALLSYDWFNPRLRVSLLVRNNPEDNQKYQTVKDLKGQRIVSSYTGLASKFFRGEKTPIQGENIYGKEEGLVKAHYAEGAVVIVDSGNTMRIAGLREMAVIMSEGLIQPVLVYNPELFQDVGSRRLLNQFLDKLTKTTDQSSEMPVSDERQERRYGRLDPSRYFPGSQGTSAVAASAAVFMTLLSLPHPAAVFNQEPQDRNTQK